MILDSGICTVFERYDASVPGGMQRDELRVMGKSWYGELNFETSPVNPTGNREDVETSARIRIHQNRAITNHNVVILADTDTAEGYAQYDVTRAYHGVDDENGQPITDLTLTVVEA